MKVFEVFVDDLKEDVRKKVLSFLGLKEMFFLFLFWRRIKCLLFLFLNLC